MNPLEPHYTLPSFMLARNHPPKFTRDSLDVSDIEGTWSRRLYPTRGRDSYLVDDIEGAQSGWKPRHVRARREAAPLNHSLDVSDITGGGFQSQRTTNPLAPSYRVNGMEIADDPIKSRPRSLPKARDGPFNPLTTEDIEGAQPGWRPMPQMHPPLEARRHFRNTNFMGDIPGAQADTVKHSICTSRHVNPLNPVYASLDGEPLPYPQTPLYNEPPCREAETQLDEIIAGEENRLLKERYIAGEGGAPEPGRRKGSSEVGSASNDFVHQREGDDLQRVRPSSEPLIHVQRQSGGRNKNSGNGNNQNSEERRDYERGRERCSQQSPAGETGATPAGKSDGISGSSARGVQRPRRSDSLMKSPWGEFVNNNTRVTSRPNSEPERVGTTATRFRELRGGSSNVLRRPSACSRGSTAGRIESRVTRLQQSSGITTCARRQQEEIVKPDSPIVGPALEIVTPGGQTRGRAERLVLRSSNGISRVTLTPAEKRMAREYMDDVNAVREL